MQRVSAVLLVQIITVPAPSTEVNVLVSTGWKGETAAAASLGSTTSHHKGALVSLSKIAYLTSSVHTCTCACYWSICAHVCLSPNCPDAFYTSIPGILVDTQNIIPYCSSDCTILPRLQCYSLLYCYDK